MLHKGLAALTKLKKKSTKNSENLRCRLIDRYGDATRGPGGADVRDVNQTEAD